MPIFKENEVRKSLQRQKWRGLCRLFWNNNNLWPQWLVARIMWAWVWTDIVDVAHCVWVCGSLCAMLEFHQGLLWYSQNTCYPEFIWFIVVDASDSILSLHNFHNPCTEDDEMVTESRKRFCKEGPWSSSALRLALSAALSVVSTSQKEKLLCGPHFLPLLLDPSQFLMSPESDLTPSVVVTASQWLYCVLGERICLYHPILLLDKVPSIFLVSGLAAPFQAYVLGSHLSPSQK